MIVADGSVPALRILGLGIVATAYATSIDGSGVAWPIALLLLGQAFFYTIALGLAASFLTKTIPGPIRNAAVATIIVLGAAAAVFSNVYRTPFDDAVIHSSWLGLLQ